jgi:hypothetical protein
MSSSTMTMDGAAMPRPDINPWIIAITVTLATFMEVLDTSIANVALPHIAGSLSRDREHLGPDFLPGFQRHRSAAQRLDLFHHWTQAFLHELRGHLYRQLAAVRTGA